MPTRDADGFGAVRFRSRGDAQVKPPHSLLAIGSTIFLAVLLALCAHDLIRLAVVGAAAKDLSRQMESEFRRLEAEFERQVPQPAQQYRQTSPRPAIQALPRYPGPMSARQRRLHQACIHGRLADRLANGWSNVEPRVACVANSD